MPGKLENYDLVVVGGGPSGMGAALEAKKQGVEKILVLERDKFLGGILPQCIHNGFGLEYFKQELTGPEYALRFKEKITSLDIEVKTETMVVDISRGRIVTALNSKEGVIKLQASAVVLAMGCRERTRENIRIPGTRAAGVFTAGTAQRYTNIEGYMPGEKVVILGSGDIGLIMARRMKLEGAEVAGVLELMPYSSGLVRNKVQCLDDFDIPLKLQHTVTRVEGKDRVEKVFVSRVDEQQQIIPGSESEIACDTLLLSVGLIPENELSKNMGIKLSPVTGGAVVNELRETSVEGVFAAGNVLHVHDLVDWATLEAEMAGRGVSRYLKGKLNSRESVLNLEPGKNVNYIVPHKITYSEADRNFTKLFMRVKKPMENVVVKLMNQDKKLLGYKKDIVTPGEMLTVNLPESILEPEMEEINVAIVARDDAKKEGKDYE